MLSNSAGAIAGVITGLFLFLGFWILGVPFTLALFYGIVGGVANSWIVAGWSSPSESKPKKEPIEPTLATKEGQMLSPRELFKLWQRERYERRNSALFWKNPRSNRLLKRLEREAAERKRKEQQSGS